MSDQARDGGHRAITHEATSRLFRQPGRHGKILGLTENEFFEKLNKWQKHADRAFFSPIANLLGEDMELGGGDTWHQAQDNPGAQRKHSMADPHKSGAENLKDIQNFIIGQLELAKGYHLERNHEAEWECLGAAVHALEDSYSIAHAFRDPLNPTDPYSSIQALNVYYWVNSTHEKTFDQVPVTNENLARGSDLAGAIAVSIIMGLYADHINDEFDTTNQLFAREVKALLHGENIQVFSDPKDPAYLAQRETHYQNEMSFDPRETMRHDAHSGPQQEKERLDVGKKEDAEKPGTVKEAPQGTNLKNQETPGKTANTEAGNTQQNPWIQQTDYINKITPAATEPLYVEPPLSPLRTDINTLQQAGWAQIKDTTAPQVPISPIGDGISNRAVNPAINPGGKQPIVPREPVEGKNKTGDSAATQGNTREVNPAINPGKKAIVPAGKEGGEVKNKVGEAAAQQGNTRESNPAIKPGKEKAKEVKVKEKTEVKPGGQGLM